MHCELLLSIVCESLSSHRLLNLSLMIRTERVERGSYLRSAIDALGASSSRAGSTQLATAVSSERLPGAIANAIALALVVARLWCPGTCSNDHGLALCLLRPDPRSGPMVRVLSPGPEQAHEQGLLPVRGHPYEEVALRQPTRRGGKSSGSRFQGAGAPPH